MKRAIAVLALATGVLPKYGLPLVRGERGNSIHPQQYRHPKRRTTYEQPCSCATTINIDKTTSCFVPSSYAPSAAAAVDRTFQRRPSAGSRRNRMRVRSQYGSIDCRRQYREGDSRLSLRQGVGEVLSGEPSSERTLKSEQRTRREGEDGADTGVFNGVLPLPLEGGTTSKITTVQVDNLAMVDSVQVKLGRGLIAITGETGAGKSLISSAFSLAAGARVRGGDMVGSKGSTARVQMELELADEHRVSTSEVLQRFGAPLADGGRKLSVTRTVGGKGSSASVNGCSVKVGDLRELMSPLIYSVDANAFELFYRADSRLRTLDRMLDPAELNIADKVRRVVEQLRKAEACRVRLEQRCRFEGGPGGAEDAALLHFWVQELDEFWEAEAAFMGEMRTVVNAFVNDWGEAGLGSLAEPLLSGTAVGEGGGVSSRNSDGEEGLSGLWPRLSRIHEAMQSLEASRTKVDEARVKTVDQSDPESIAHMLGNIRDILIDAEDENVGLNQDLLEEVHEDLNSLEDYLARAGDKLETLVESLPRFPIRINEVEERIARWRELARKHGVPPERLGSMQSQLRVELDELIVAAEALPLARQKENSWRILAEQVVGELSAVRRRAALEVEQLINPMMADVGMEGVTVKVLVEDSQTLGLTGADRVQFVMEANQGQTRGTVEAVASSGEKSRILLLLETHLPPPQARSSAELGRRTLEWDGEMVVEHDQAGGLLQADSLSDASGRGGLERVAAPCAVLYDEIDAHVGGRTAVAVGKLLANQGRDSQVVVVTHTASVAALADQHLVVEKNAGNARAGDAATAAADVDTTNSPADDRHPLRSGWRTRRHGRNGNGNRGVSVAIREVRGVAREEEVARMAAGNMGGEAASELAREMLRYSRRQESPAPDVP